MRQSFCDLSNRVAIVTGGGTGIGKAIALELAQVGANIILASRNPTHLEGSAQQILHMGRKCLRIKTDVRQPDQVDHMVKKSMEEMGRIDILINNAGGSFTPEGGEPTKLLEDIPVEELDFILDTNLKSVLLVTRAVVPYMKKQHYGRIINVASMAGRVGIPFNTLPYSAAKAGVIGFTRILAYQLGPVGITVNAVAPGYILSGERWASRWEQRKKTGDADKIMDWIALKRLGTPEEVAGVVAFLASEKASYITGSTIDIFGGAYTL